MQIKQVTNKQIVTALLIGDGTLQCSLKSGHYRISTISSKDSFEDYHMWKHELLSRVYQGKVNICVDNRKSPLLHSWISSKSYVEPYYKFLYQNINGVNKKVCSKFLQRLNHPLCLAIWFMDDGNCSGNKSRSKVTQETYFKSYTMYLGTNQFNYSDHELMVKWFKKEFNITPKIYKQVYFNVKHCGYGREEYRLGFNAKEARKIWSLIEPYVVQFNSMKYKFRFAYTIDTLGIKKIPIDYDFTQSAKCSTLE